MPSSTHTKKRLTYVLKENNNKTLLGIPDASARINRTFPLYSRLEEAMETSMTTLDKDDHPRHSLGVTTLALDTATQLSGKPGPEGILYTSGKDGLVASWQLGIQTRQRNRRYGTDTPVEHFSEKFEIEREPESAPIFRQCVQTHTDHCNDILLAMHNQVLVSASSDRTVKAWRPHGDAQVPTVVGTHADFVKVLSHARDRHWVASGGLDRFARLWDLNQGGEVVRLPSQHSVYSLATNHSASLLLTGTPSRAINVWDPRSAKLTHNLDGHTGNIRSLLLSEDSTKALSASSDSTIKLWDLRNMSTVTTFEHHSDSVWSLFSQSPSLDTFYSGDRQGRICKVVGEDVRDVATARHGITKLVASDDKLVVSASASSSSVSIWSDADHKEQEEEVDQDATPKLTTRAPSISSRISTTKDPLAVIHGRHGIIRALMLNNRRHVLTLNTQRHVSLWDIVTCVCVGQYTDDAVDAILGADEDADTLTSQEVLERVRDKIEGQAVTNAWNSIDCQTGSLAVHLDESRCFDGEAYLDELGIPVENGETDQRVNLAKLVLTNLLRHFIDYEKKHISDERPKPSPETNDKAYINQNAGTPTVNTPSGTPQIGVSRQLATPPATPALPPPALADPPPSERERILSSHGNRGDYVAFEKKNELQSVEKSAFLEASQNRPALTLRSPDNESVGETSGKKIEASDGSSTPALTSPVLSSSPSNSRLGGLMGRMLISNSRRDKKESIKREESKESSPVITPTPMPEPTNTMDSVKSRFKPATDDVTSIILNDNIPIGVSEETHDSEAFVSVYRGLVGTTGEPGDVKHLEKSLPEWVLEMVLCNNVYKDARTPKATFWLERHPDEKDLGDLPESGNRLTASRFLRARKLMNYVRDKLPADKTVGNENPVEEELELYCNNVKLDVKLTLGAIKSFIWQTRRNDEPDDDSLIDPVIYYKRT